MAAPVGKIALYGRGIGQGIHPAVRMLGPGFVVLFVALEMAGLTGIGTPQVIGGMNIAFFSGKDGFAEDIIWQNIPPNRQILPFRYLHWVF